MNPQILHPDDELLVAYLDRQLNTSERRDVELRLASDSAFRERLDGLQRSWDALDALPVPTWDAASAATTMSIVAMSAEEEQSSRTPTRGLPPKWSPWLQRTLLVAAGVLVGFACIAVPMWIQYNARLRDLPVSYRMDAYRAVGDLSFLRALDHEGVFSEDIVDDETDPVDLIVSSDETLADIPFAITSDTAAVDEALHRMPIDDILELKSRSQRFAALPRAEQSELRQFHDTLVRQPDASHLFALLTRFHDWIAMLPSSDRAELMQLPATERMEKIRTIVTQQLRRHPDWMGVIPGDLKHLHTWTAEYVKQHSSDLIALLPERQQEMLNRIENADRRTWFLVHAISSAPPRVKDNLPELTDTEKIRFLEGFSPELTRKISKELQMHGTRAIFDALHSMSLHRRGNPRRRQQFFENLPPHEKEALLKMRPEQVPQELRDRYRRWQDGPGTGRRPPGPPRPPDDQRRRDWHPEDRPPERDHRN